MSNPEGMCWDRCTPMNCRLPLGHHGRHQCTCCGLSWENKATTEACHSTEVAVLGVVGSPARLRCGLLDEHDGPHRFSMEWADNPRHIGDVGDGT